MLLKYTALILKILLFLTCCECKILSYPSGVAISRVQMIHSVVICFKFLLHVRQNCFSSCRLVLNRCWTILLLLFLSMLNLLPEFDSSFRKELASVSYFSFMILYVSIISPMILLYAIVGKFTFFCLSC